MKFTQVELEKLLERDGNAYLKKSAEEKYKDFSKVDPFPQISASLLNSKDIVQYILTTGMIDKFEPENLMGATYSCEFSGEYIFWDENNIKHTYIVPEQDSLIIKPNTIVFLGIKPFFYIPEYLILRFNLRVKNVYKGLLLGTGPIVDPGFVGKLYIPLHNLTSNEYCIKRNALLIDIEFTKLSNNDRWKLDAENLLDKIVKNLDFGNLLYIPKYFESKRDSRSYDSYIEDALTAEPFFFKTDREIPFINSSIQEVFKKINKMEKDISQRIKELDDLKKFFTYTVVSVIIAAVSLFATTGWYFLRATEVTEMRKQIEEQKVIIEQLEKNFDKLLDMSEIVKDIEKRLNVVE